MAHELETTATGEVSIALVGGGKTAWHGLGQELAPGTSAYEAYMALPTAGHVRTGPVFVEIDGEMVPADDNVRGTVRVLPNGAKNVLATDLSDHYQVIQDADTARFADEIVRPTAERFGVPFGCDTIMTLAKGRRFVVTYDLGTIDPTGMGDLLRRCVVVANDHTGREAMRAIRSHVRVVCANTERAAFAGAESTVRILHKGTVDMSTNEIRRQLKLAEDAEEEYADIVQRMSATPLTRTALVKVCDKLWPKPDDADGIAGRKWANRREVIADAIWPNDRNAGSFGHNAWTGLQAVNEYMCWNDHGANDTRQANILLGVGSAGKRAGAAWAAFAKLAK